MRRGPCAAVVALLFVSMLTLTAGTQPAKAGPAVQLMLETDKSVYKTRENITITLTNISNDTVPWTGRCPVPWDIFTYPENQCVFAAFPCFCIFFLAPGENVTYTWNQSDWYTINPVGPGTYEVRDNQAWGLSEYFMIVDAEVVVPDDYPSIQKAINAACLGDTVFVGSGTYEEYVNVNKSLSIRGENVQNTGVIAFEVHADNVSISGFTVHAGSCLGVEVSGFSQCNISGNIIFSDFYPIGLMHSARNHVSNNQIHCVVYGSGITLIDCNDTIISRNKLSSGEVGVHLMESYNNILCENGLSNFDIGVYIGGLFNNYHNLIYHNNLVNNQEDATDLTGGNLWDNGCEGNYWSNYNGTDLSNDGIGDTCLPWEGVDNYPLVNPYWNPADIDHDLRVSIFDAVKCTIAYGSTPSDPDWNPHTDIADPYGVIDIFDLVMIASSYGLEYVPEGQLLG